MAPRQKLSRARFLVDGSYGLLHHADDYLAPSELAARSSKVSGRSLGQEHNTIEARLKVTAIEKACDFAQLFLVRLDDEKRRFSALILCSLTIGRDRDNATGGFEDQTSLKAGFRAIGRRRSNSVKN